MATASKDTVYIDLEDDITTIIDKVQASPHKIIALVMPKRAATLQSIVNMRLLKRSADNAKKRIVLITSEAGLLPLAGSVGIHVARNLQSKPVIPPAPEKVADEVSDVADTSEEPIEEAIDPTTPVGVLAVKGDVEEPETIELDDDTELAGDKSAAAGAKSPRKDKKLVVPNFDKFRLILGLAIAGVVLMIVFIILAFTVLPKAKVTVKTDTTSVTGNLVATTSGSLKILDEAKSILPSVSKELKQTTTEKTAATGSRDVGAKASGTITIRNCDYASGFTISAGWKFTSNGVVFVNQTQATVPAFTGSSSSCSLSGSHSGKVDLPVQALESGTAYNLDSSSYTIQSIPDTAKVDAIGTAMSGGTSRIAKVVSGQDIESAKQRIATKTANVATDFYKQLEASGSYVLQETATTSDPKFTSTPALNEEATSDVTVTQDVTYKVMTVNKSDLTKLLKNALNKQIDTKKQQLSTGDLLNKATIRASEIKSPTEATISVEKTTTATPILNLDQIKKDIAGKKKSEIQSLLTSRPGVQDVTVSYSPFWVSSAPKKPGKITIIINDNSEK